jgi:polyisoprenoid-binding protein YceI
MKTHLSKLISISIVLIIALVSCDSSEKNELESVKLDKNEVKAVENTPAIDSLFTKQYEIGNYNIKKGSIKSFELDNEKSLLTWFCVTHTGYVKFKGGRLEMSDNKIVAGEFEIAMDSIRDTDIDYDLMRIVLENTLKSDSFFNVKAHPVSIFRITHIKNIESDKYFFGGDLQINGKNNKVSFRSQIIQNDSSILVLTDRFYIDRTKWGVTIYSRNFEQTDNSFLFTDSVSMKVTAVLNKLN